jgi:hypothetical protein
VRLAVASDHILYIVTVRPNYLFAHCSGTLVYAFQARKSRKHFMMFWNTVTHEQHCKPSQPIMALAGHGQYTLAVTQSAHWGQSRVSLFNSIGSPVDTRSVPFEPSVVAITAMHAVACSAEVVYIWHYCTRQVRLVVASAAP